MTKKVRTYSAALKAEAVESFWGILKNELVYHEDYKTRFEAISDITKYIELEYNQTRIKTGLSYKTPRQVWFDFYRQAA